MAKGYAKVPQIPVTCRSLHLMLCAAGVEEVILRVSDESVIHVNPGVHRGCICHHISATT